MPSNIFNAVNFLETQWPSINENKIKGILAEIRLKSFLLEHNTYFGPGGWIITPGKPTTHSTIPTANKICLIPRPWYFSWQSNHGTPFLSPAEISAYNYFRQLGVQTYFTEPVNINEEEFLLPTPRNGNTPASYPKPYNLNLKIVAPNGQLELITSESVFRNFPTRNGSRGLKCHLQGRINTTETPWDDPSIISELFWFEYSRYYFQINYLLSNNDLDMYVIGSSGSAYPVELKSKKAANSATLGEWFGIDMGPFAKLAFFTANSMNTDALYVVEEVDSSDRFVSWLAIRYTELVKACSWVGQSGGTGMTGGTSSTFKIPKAAFTPLATMLHSL